MRGGVSRPKPLVLMILDGWGINPREDANAIAQAAPPFYRSLLENYPYTTLDASGEAVGLPRGQMGNSEVGHLNIGAGRIVYQELTRITKAISDGSFFQKRALRSALQSAKSDQTCFHLLGLLSDGGVHSHINHLVALLEAARQAGILRLRVHAFLDGRDTPPKSALGYIRHLERSLKDAAPAGGDWRIASLSGRYYAMDRDQRWDRTAQVYRAMVSGDGLSSDTAAAGLQASYDAGLTDEFVRPTVICEAENPVGKIQDGDHVFFFNFRADRARQLSHAFSDAVFDFFPRSPKPALASMTCLTSYDKTLHLPVVFEPAVLHHTLGEVFSEHSLRQLRIAETEKYAHVTYFFSGGREECFEGEKRILIPSPKEVKTYDQKPEMSAFEVTEAVIQEIQKNRFDFICLNFANPDMVGHSGDLSAAVKAVEVIDRCLKRIVETVAAEEGIVLLTADHGNLEQMIDYQTGLAHTAHTTHRVPFICISKQKRALRPGTHANIAPTVLDLLHLPKPAEMDHDSLIGP
ncbi:MAG: 2,3-bisphosphoglycerate-independent phosphoglycerate mutase [Nitrospiria bacterium]